MAGSIIDGQRWEEGWRGEAKEGDSEKICVCGRAEYVTCNRERWRWREKERGRRRSGRHSREIHTGL